MDSRNFTTQQKWILEEKFDEHVENEKEQD